MRVTSWLATLALLAWAGLAQADQPKSVFDNGVDAPTLTLQGDGEGDTELVHGGWRGGWGGGYRGWGGYGGGWGGGYRGWGGGWYGGYGGGWGYGYGHHHHYRPYVNFSFGYYPRYYSSYYYRPWNYGYSSFYYPSYYGIGYNSYYYQPYYYGGYYCINGTESDATVQATPLGQLPYVPSVTPEQLPNNSGQPTTPEGQVPFQYDGGPNNLVPLPSDTPQPQKNTQPAPQAPLKGHLVSIPGNPQTSGFAFPAYGSEAQIPSSQPAPATSGFAFPAYGEQSQSSGFATKQ